MPMAMHNLPKDVVLTGHNAVQQVDILIPACEGSAMNTVCLHQQALLLRTCQKQRAKTSKFVYR